MKRKKNWKIDDSENLSIANYSLFLIYIYIYVICDKKKIK